MTRLEEGQEEERAVRRVATSYIVHTSTPSVVGGSVPSRVESREDSRVAESGLLDDLKHFALFKRQTTDGFSAEK